MLIIKLIDIITPTKITIILVVIKIGLIKESFLMEFLLNKNKIPFSLDNILLAYLT